MSYKKPGSVKACEENLEIKDLGTGKWKNWTIERFWDQLLFHDNVKLRKKEN